MILYRIMSNYDLKTLMGAKTDDSEKKTIAGANTFRYKPNLEYIHFFRYAEHAKNLMSTFGEIIMQCDIPDKLIDQEGFGFYDGEIGVIPECIIKKSDFDVNFIKGFKYDLTVGWCNPKLGYDEYPGKYIGSYGELYEQLYRDIEEEYYKYDYHQAFGYYVVNKLKGKNLDKLLLKYIDRVHDKHFPTPKTVFSKFIRRK